MPTDPTPDLARRALWCALARLHRLDADPPAAPPRELAALCRAAGLDRRAARDVWLVEVTPAARVSLFERWFGPPPWATEEYAEVDEPELIARIEARIAARVAARNVASSAAQRAGGSVRPGAWERLLGEWWALPVRRAWRRVEAELR